MQQEDQVNVGTRGRRIRWRRWFVVTLAVLVVALVVNGLLSTPEKALAAFDAARAVADEDNAALIYAELLRGEEVPPVATEQSTAMARILEATLDPVSLREFGMSDRRLVTLELPDELLDPNDEESTLREPWTSAAHPELRQWLNTHQSRIERLLEASRKPSCYFPLSPTSGHMGLFDIPLGGVRQNAFLLRRAANNDLAEGDITAALTKYQALASMGRHLKTQPGASHLNIGIACEALGLYHQIEFVVTGPATDAHLDILVTDTGDLESHWPTVRQDITRVRNLFRRTLKDRRRIAIRIAMAYHKVRYQNEGWLTDRGRELYHRVLSERRALCLLIELRRFRNRTGQWPDRLDEIASSVTALALIDPQNGGSYVYQPTGDGFRLYSAGPNGQDERGQYAWKGPDDWPIWPPRGSATQPRPADANAP